MWHIYQQLNTTDGFAKNECMSHVLNDMVDGEMNMLMKKCTVEEFPTTFFVSKWR
jgi:hypothetical protein